MPLSSAIRCPEHNTRISRTGPDGPHTTGRAVDVLIRGGDVILLTVIAAGHGMRGIGWKQAGDHRGRFVHLDDLPSTMGPRPWAWTY